MAESLRPLGAQRTATQDIEFAIDQLVEIAARALSGINDPSPRLPASTASARRWPPARKARPCRPRCGRTQNGRPRIIAAPVSFTDAIDTAFNPIRQCAGNSAAVTIRLLLEVLAEIETAGQQERRPRGTAPPRLDADAQRQRPAWPEHDDRGTDVRDATCCCSAHSRRAGPAEPEAAADH